MGEWVADFDLDRNNLFGESSHLIRHDSGDESLGTNVGCLEEQLTVQAVEEMRTAFDRRRQRMFTMLNEIPGVRCVEPEGAFYAYPSFKGVLGRTIRDRTPETTLDLAELLLDEARVAIVPGALFFGEALGSSFLGMFSTHPPLHDRIRRIDPSWDGTYPKVVAPAAPETLREEAARRIAEARQGRIVRGVMRTPEGVVLTGGALAAAVERLDAFFQSLTEEQQAIVEEAATEALAYNRQTSRSAEDEALVLAQVDLARIEDVRRNWPFLRDRRTDAYGGIEHRFLTD